LRVAVAVLGVAAVGLVVAAAAVYRDGAGTAPPPLAKRGLEMQSTRAALFAATKLDSDAPEPAPSDAAPAVVLGSDSATPPSSSAAAALPGLATGARPPGAGATASAGTGPGNTGAGNSSPGTAGPGNMGAGSTGAGSTGAGKAWNPFDERN
jgi:hypothetical protein